MRYRVYVHEFVGGRTTLRHLVVSGYHFQAHASSSGEAVVRFVNLISNAPKDTRHMNLALEASSLKPGKVPEKIGTYGDYPVFIHRQDYY